MKYISFIFLVIVCFECVSGNVELTNPAIDQSIIENYVDPDLCQLHLSLISNNSELNLRFLDAGLRLPKGILKGNLADFGSFFQCLEINEGIDGSNIEGKYCSISIPLDQSADISDVQFQDVNAFLDSGIEERIMQFGRTIETRTGIVSAVGNRSLNVAVCVPKSCSTDDALQSILFESLATDFMFEENFCRVPGDKPWGTADYVASGCFGVIFLITILSTAYDIRHTIILKRDPKSANVLFQSCSVYTNCRRLVTYSSSPKTIECLDGIRVLAMLWIILGHTYSTQLQLNMANLLDAIDWLSSIVSIWVTAAPISVDTFFTLSGTLLVYTAAGKMEKWTLLKNIHVYYLNRLLRMFPILAAGVLLQASWLNHVADGPQWPVFARAVDMCRKHWWTTLLHVQNYVQPESMCLDHSWYLAVDVQLHILSPLVLFWVLSSKRAGWVATIAGLATSVVASSIFIAVFLYEPNAQDLSDLTDTVSDRQFFTLFYINTLTRSPSFFVGMLFGYFLYSCRGKKVYLDMGVVAAAWCLWLAVFAVLIYSTYPTQQRDWDNNAVDYVLNCFKRPVWAATICWLIFACHHGYAGPVNWFLSLRMWKLPSRLSYAMYIFHYPLVFLENTTSLSPKYFGDHVLIFKYFGDLGTTLIAAFFVTLLIDAPFSTLIKLALGGGLKSTTRTKKAQDNIENENSGDNEFTPRTKVPSRADI